MRTISNVGILKVSDLQTGDIILVDSHSFLGNTIDIFQGNRFNHAAFHFSYNNLNWLYEAVKTGAGFNLLLNNSEYHQEEYLFDRYQKGEVDIMVLRLKKNNWKTVNTDKLLNWMMVHSTDGYDFVNLFIWQSVKYTWKWITGKEKWIGKGMRHKFICGQLVAKIYNRFLGLFNDEWESIAPVDLFNSDLFNHYKLSK